MLSRRSAAWHFLQDGFAWRGVFGDRKYLVHITLHATKSRANRAIVADTKKQYAMLAALSLEMDRGTFLYLDDICM